MSTLGTSSTHEALKGVSREQLDLLVATWPEHFGCLFDMGLKAFESLFNYRPQLLALFHLPPDADWKKDEMIKKIVLSLEQTLVKAVGTFGEKNPDASHTVPDFISMMQDIGGMHRALIPQLSPDNFEVLFRLLPEVIVDVISSRRKNGPLEAEERATLVATWTGICQLMTYHVVLGWERRIVPRLPKFAKPCRSDQPSEVSAARQRASASFSVGSSSQSTILAGPCSSASRTGRGPSGSRASSLGDGGQSSGHGASTAVGDGRVSESQRRSSSGAVSEWRYTTSNSAHRSSSQDEIERAERGTLLLGDVSLCLCDDQVSLSETSDSPKTLSLRDQP